MPMLPRQICSRPLPQPMRPAKNLLLAQNPPLWKGKTGRKNRNSPRAKHLPILSPPNGEPDDMTVAVQQFAPQQGDSEKIDVAMNIFAKPYQTALSVLSLLKHSGNHGERNALRELGRKIPVVKHDIRG